MCLYSWVDPGCWFKAPNAPDRGSWLMGLCSVLPQAGLPTRQVRKKIKVDTSKFMTPYLAHSQKMLDQFSHVGNIWFVVLFFFWQSPQGLLHSLVLPIRTSTVTPTTSPEGNLLHLLLIPLKWSGSGRPRSSSVRYGPGQHCTFFFYFHLKLLTLTLIKKRKQNTI